MFSKSLQWRLVFIFIFITFILMTVVWFFLTISVEKIFYQDFKSNIEIQYNNLGITKENTINDVIDKISDKDNGLFILVTAVTKSYTILDKITGEIKHTNDSLYYENENEFKKLIYKSKNLKSVMASKAGEEKVGEDSNFISIGNNAYYDYVKSIVLRDGEYVLYFKNDREVPLRMIESFNTIIMFGLIIAICSSLIIGYILSKRITIPIVNIMFKAQEIADGNFGQVLEAKSNDEIGRLTKTFNYMSKRLKNTLNEISSEKNKVETILNYMTDGVIAFNLEGNVIHVNPAARKMLDVTLLDFTFNDFCNKYQIDIMLEDILYLEVSITKEKSIEVNNKFIRVYFALFTDEQKKAEGIIAVLQDITEQEKLEGMRREFVANVSHELRTPLTSIKSYAETLLDGAMEDRPTCKKFLTVIDSEVDRMTRLVKDLLQLTQLDNNQMKWNMKNISLVELVKSTVEKMQIPAQNKSQTLESYVIGEIPNISADKDRIEQLIINIISNALKYTPVGGKITVFVGKIYSEVYIKVVDTGIGIPKGDLERVFERFYRVDKARSREMGGTGLGLSIAKEIVEAHGGTISANSNELEKGTEITIKLPRV